MISCFMKLAASWRNARSTASRRSSSNAGGMHATGNSRPRLPYRRLGARISIHPHPDFWRHGLSAGPTSCSVQGTWTGATYLRSAVRRFNPGPFAPPHGGLGRQAPRTSDTRRRGSPRNPRCREGAGRRQLARSHSIQASVVSPPNAAARSERLAIGF